MVHAPFSMLAGIVPTIYQYSGSVAVPLVLGISGIGVLVFSVASGAMSRHLKHSGGLYAFVAAAFGPGAGLAAAVVGIAAYLCFLSTGLVVFSGAMSALLTIAFSVTPPAWTGVLVGGALVTILAQLRLTTVIRTLAATGVFLFGGLVCLDIAAVSHPAGQAVSFEALDPASLLTGSFVVALALASTAFIGSELGPVFADEVAEPHRTVPRATVAGYLIVTVVLVVSAWAISVTLGPEEVVTAARGSLQSLTGSQGQPLALEVALRITGQEHAKATAIWLTAALAASALSISLVLSLALTRQFSALARDGALPRSLRRTGRWAPAGLLVPALSTAAGLAAVAIGAARATLYGGTIGSLGVTLLITLAGLAIALWFLRSDEHDTGFLGWEVPVVAGAFTAVTAGFIFVYSLLRLPDVLGGDGATARWLFPLGTLGPAALGMAWALALRVLGSASTKQVRRSVAVPTASQPGS